MKQIKEQKAETPHVRQHDAKLRVIRRLLSIPLFMLAILAIALGVIFSIPYWVLTGKGTIDKSVELLDAVERFADGV